MIVQSLRAGSDDILHVVADRQSPGDGDTGDLQRRQSGNIRQRGWQRRSTIDREFVTSAKKKIANFNEFSEIKKIRKNS